MYIVHICTYRQYAGGGCVCIAITVLYLTHVVNKTQNTAPVMQTADLENYSAGTPI